MDAASSRMGGIDAVDTALCKASPVSARREGPGHIRGFYSIFATVEPVPRQQIPLIYMYKHQKNSEK